LLISGSYYPPQVGGISRFMELVASGLGPRHVCCLTGAAGDGALKESGGPRVYRYPSLVGASKTSKAIGWTAALTQIMIRERPRVIILGSVDDSHFGLWLSRWFRLPFIVFAYGNEVLETIQRRYERQHAALRLANRVLVSSRYTASLAERAGAGPDRIKVVWPGCDSEFFRPLAGNAELRRKLLGPHYHQRAILTVGNLVARKGQDMVIRALPDLCRRVPDLVYMIAGDGPYRGELEKLATDLGVRDRVVFIGRVQDEDLPALYSLCEVFVMASRARIEESDVEGFGIVLLEASACGKPVVGGRSGGVPDAVVDGFTGLLVDPSNPQEIADALAKLMTDHELAKRLAEQGRARVVNEFQWEMIGQEILSTLEIVQREGVVSAKRAMPT
jgi:phosphatidylinositol alpha-1,6-mannosyltransferase